MINIAVRAFALPKLRVKAEMGGHIFVDKLLKIDSKGPVASHHEVGTNALVRGQIAPWIGQIIVSRIVFHLFRVRSRAAAASFLENSSEAWSSSMALFLFTVEASAR